MTLKGLQSLAAIIHNVYGVKFDQAKMDIWDKLLKDVNDTHALEALYKLCKTFDYPPNPSIIRSEIMRSRLNIRTREHAMDDIRRMISENTTNIDVHPMSKAFVEEKGLQELGDMNEEEFNRSFKYDWKTFAENYIRDANLNMGMIDNNEQKMLEE